MLVLPWMMMADEGRLTLTLRRPAVCHLEDTVVFYMSNGCLISFADREMWHSDSGSSSPGWKLAAGALSDGSHDSA